MAELERLVEKLLSREQASTSGAEVKYLTTAELAARLRTPVESVRYWRHIGKGPVSFKVGRRVLYAVEDVEAFIREARNAETNVHAGGAA